MARDILQNDPAELSINRARFCWPVSPDAFATAGHMAATMVFTSDPSAGFGCC